MVSPLASFINDAPYYFTVSSQNQNAEIMEEAGFQSEYLILYLTSLGFGTCYIAAFVDFEYLQRKIFKNEKEKILIFSPFGYPSSSFFGFFTNSIIQTGTMLLTGKSRKDINEIVFYKKWGNIIDNNLNEKMRIIFESTRLAPSGANLQSWRFLILEDKIYAFAVSTVQSKMIKNDNLWGADYRRFDVGISLCHFTIAAISQEYTGIWQKPNEEDICDLKSADIPDDAVLVAVYNK